jgi:HAMP domain-containing protein
MVIDTLVSIALLVAILFNIAILYVLKGKLDKLEEVMNDLEEYINDTQTRMDSIDEQESEEEDESMEKAAANVFNLVDDILEGKKDLEDLKDEERQSIQQ